MSSPKKPASITNLRPESETPHLLVEQQYVGIDVHPLAVVEVKPKEQPRISLGDYVAEHPPKGFAIHIHPDPEPEAIATQVTKLGTGREYELVLHIANYGDKTITAEIWQL